jgi:hypothetical protein
MELGRQRSDRFAMKNRRRIRHHNQPAIEGRANAVMPFFKLVSALHTDWARINSG